MIDVLKSCPEVLESFPEVLESSAACPRHFTGLGLEVWVVLGTSVGH